MGEIVTGTSGNDTFSAVLDGVAVEDGTLNVGDTIVGGEGTDTFNLLIATAANALPAGASVSGVEVININQTAAALTIAATGIRTAAFTGAKEVWQVNTGATAANYDNVTASAGVTVGFRGNNATTTVEAVQTVTAADGVNALSVAFAGVGDDTDITFAETTADDVETITVSGSVAPEAVGVAGDVNLGAAADLGGLSTLNLGFTSAVDLAVENTVLANVETLNASSSTGGITVALTKSDFDADAVAITFGSGNDNVSLNLAAGAAANQMLVKLGGGDDIVTITAGGNLTAVGKNAALLADLVIIDDFAKANDTLDVSALGLRETQNVVNAALTAANPTTLLAAVEAVAAIDGNPVAIFAFGGNTYIFEDTVNDGDLTAGDTLIQLTGVAVADLVAANFVI